MIDLQIFLPNYKTFMFELACISEIYFALFPHFKYKETKC